MGAAASSGKATVLIDDTQKADSQDIGNIVHLEHLNLKVPDKGVAETFYVEGLGLSKDPALKDHPTVTWYQIGRQQFHIAKGDKAQRTQFPVKLVLHDRGKVLSCLSSVVQKLQGTQFEYSTPDSCTIAVTDPWGQRYDVVTPEHEPVHFDRIEDVRVPIAPGTATAIGKFYVDIYEAPVVYKTEQDAQVISVKAGPGTTVTFAESEKYPDIAAAISSFEGWHVCLYIASFSKVFQNVDDAGVNYKGSTLQDALKAHQFWAFDIVALSDSSAGSPNSFAKGDKIYRVGHELRSTYHPRYLSNLAPVKQ